MDNEGKSGRCAPSLTQATHELLGEDGGAIVKFWMSVLADGSAKISERMEASRLLAEFGWGKTARDARFDGNLEDEQPPAPEIYRPTSDEDWRGLVLVAIEVGTVTREEVETAFARGGR
jgi:hypothetical protein